MNNEQQLVQLLQAAYQHAMQMQMGIMALSAAGLLIQGLIVYMFYARLGDIADELRKFRIAFDFASERQPQAKGNMAEDRSG